MAGAGHRQYAPQQLIWQPPPGWIQTAAGVWTPHDYRPSRWELPAPVIASHTDAVDDWIRCSQSLPYFAFRHVWTLDTDAPDSTQSVRKVPAYGYLRRFFSEVQSPCNVHVEKTRQMVMSWAWMVVFAWDALFHKRYAGLVLSKRSTDVDDGGINSTPNSNLGKVKFILDHLPEHLWQPYEIKKFMVRIPKMQSSIKGETGKGGMAARGPTFDRALMDEAGYVDRSETVFKGIRQAAKTGTALNSTPNGKGNVFYRIRASTTTTFKKLSFHWSEHPRKAIGLYCLCGWKPQAGSGLTPRDAFDQHRYDCPRLSAGKSPEMRSPWYDRQRQDFTEEQIASELDISYEKSQRGRVFHRFDSHLNVMPLVDQLGPRRIDETPEEYRWRYLRMAIDRTLQSIVLWDFGVGDPAAMLFGQVVNDEEPWIRILDEVEEADQSYDYFAKIVKGLWLPVLKATKNPYAILHYGDPAGRNRESNLMSWVTNLKTEGIIINTGMVAGKQTGVTSLKDQIDFINDQLTRGQLQFSDWCAGSIDAMQQLHYPLDKDGNPVPGEHAPVHDEYSHKTSAVRYLYGIRYAEKILDRRSRGVGTRKILARGRSYDRHTEHRLY